jgi:predicted porin
MKKTLLAVAIPAAIFANSASATELYKDEVNTFAIGGHVALGVTGESKEAGEVLVDSRSPRINFEVTRDLGNGFMVDAKGEWSINMLDGGDSSFTTRLGYAGLTHDTWGRVVVGTQWTPYSVVSLVADMPIAFANDFSYENQGDLGVARADKMVSYSKTFDLGNDANIGFGLGWQGAHTDGTIDDKNKVQFDDRIQATVSATFVGITAGYGYTGGDIKTDNKDENATSHIVSLAYGQFGKGLYLAGTYGMNDYMNKGSTYGGGKELTRNNYLEETIVTDFIAAYALDNSLNFMVNYEAVIDDKRNDTVYSQTAIQVEYTFLPNVMGYVGYEIDLGGDGVYDNEDENNIWTIGTRIYL